MIPFADLTIPLPADLSQLIGPLSGCLVAIASVLHLRGNVVPVMSTILGYLQGLGKVDSTTGAQPPVPAPATGLTVEQIQEFLTLARALRAAPSPPA